jgi:Trpc4-associated protein
MEHIHGPTCDCNPESALRVQYLRLVHNFYDRDFLGNSNKKLLLSSAEKALLTRCGSPNVVSKEGFFIGNNDKGIFTRIVHTLLKEPMESVYRFWLSSCLESFLRGSGLEEQVYIYIYMSMCMYIHIYGLFYGD